MKSSVSSCFFSRYFCGLNCGSDVVNVVSFSIICLVYIELLTFRSLYIKDILIVGVFKITEVMIMRQSVYVLRRLPSFLKDNPHPRLSFPFFSTNFASFYL